MPTVNVEARQTDSGRRAGRLDGAFALVTGASQGIGRAIAVRFAEEGATVAINARHESPETEDTLALVGAASRRTGQGVREHLVLAADVSEESQVVAMFAELERRWSRLDVLVNNAGIQSGSDSHRFDAAEMQRIIHVNLLGAAYCARSAVRHFLERSVRGVVLNCSSVHETIPKPGYLAYSMSKGGLGNLTRTLALEYAAHGIRVNAVAPGAVATPMNESWVGDPEKTAQLEAHIPLGRVANAEEIAGVFAFLASADAAYITGQTIYVCGGLTLYGDFRSNWAS